MAEHGKKYAIWTAFISGVFAVITALITLITSLVTSYTNSEGRREEPQPTFHSTPYTTAAQPFPEETIRRIDIAGTWIRDDGNVYNIMQNGDSVTISAFLENNEEVAARGTISGKTVKFEYSVYQNAYYSEVPVYETGEGYMTLSEDGRRLIGEFTKAQTNRTFLLNMSR